MAETFDDNEQLLASLDFIHDMDTVHGQRPLIQRAALKVGSLACLGGIYETVMHWPGNPQAVGGIVVGLGYASMRMLQAANASTLQIPQEPVFPSPDLE